MRSPIAGIAALIALFVVIMIGAVWTVLRVGDSLAPPIIVGALLALLSVLRTRQAAPA